MGQNHSTQNETAIPSFIENTKYNYENLPESG